MSGSSTIRRSTCRGPKSKWNAVVVGAGSGSALKLSERCGLCLTGLGHDDPKAVQIRKSVVEIGDPKQSVTKCTSIPPRKNTVLLTLLVDLKTHLKASLCMDVLQFPPS